MGERRANRCRVGGMANMSHLTLGWLFSSIKISLFVTLLWGVTFSEEAEENIGYTQIQIHYYGLLSRSLNEYQKETLQSNLIDLLKQDPEFKLKNWSQVLDSLKYFYSRNLQVKNKDIFPSLSRGRYENGLFVTLEKVDENFLCYLKYVENQKKEPVVITRFVFHSEVNLRIRKIARLLHHSIRRHFNLEGEKEEPSILLHLKNPLMGAELVYDDEVIKEDSIHNILKGTKVVTSEKFNLKYINGSGFKMILYPKSSYTFIGGSHIKLNYGRLSVIALDEKLTVQSKGVTCYAQLAMFTLFQSKKSRIELYAGTLIAHPTSAKNNKDTLLALTKASSYGQNLYLKKIDKENLPSLFKVFMPLINKKIIKRFTKNKSSLFSEPIYVIDYFHSEVSDPMDYFIAEGFSDIGISLEALMFEGQDWQAITNTLKTGINETGCFLCKPNGRASSLP